MEHGISGVVESEVVQRQGRQPIRDLNHGAQRLLLFSRYHGLSNWGHCGRLIGRCWVTHALSGRLHAVEPIVPGRMKSTVSKRSTVSSGRILSGAEVLSGEDVLSITRPAGGEL